MKLGALGAVDSISRFDQTKPGAKDAQASGALSSSNARLAGLTKNQSKEDTKNFSRILKDVDQPTNPKREDDSDVEDGAVGLGLEGAASQRQNTSVQKSAAEESPTNERVGNSNSNRPTEISNDGVEAARSKPEEKISLEDKIEALAENLKETAETELSMRHLSMRDFLVKMKDEFGVEPGAVVKAFAKLDQATLAAPADQTSEAVLGQLGLKPEQLPKAERFYREMLNQTGDSALNETLVGVGAGITLNVLSEQDVAMDRLQRSILGLNDAFARRETPAPNELVPVADTASPALISSLAIPPLQVETEMGTVEDADDSVLSVENETETADLPESKSTNESKFASLGAALAAATAEFSSGASADGNGRDGSSEKKPDINADVKPVEVNTIETALAGSRFDVAASAEKGSVPLAAGTATSAALATAVGNQDGESASTNAQDLVRHAQLLIKNGGGEMKMSLKPEGVGDVTLKVAVKDGQVAIQMMTANDSAKKIIESNLDELKTSLAQHKLHVDALKIEVGGEMAKQRFEQAQQDSSREQARQMAQDFMGQFRQDREGFRQGFSDASGFRNYQQPKRNPLPEIEPVVVASSSNGKNSGERRLNLVA